MKRRSIFWWIEFKSNLNIFEIRKIWIEFENFWTIFWKFFGFTRIKIFAMRIFFFLLNFFFASLNLFELFGTFFLILLNSFFWNFDYIPKRKLFIGFIERNFVVKKVNLLV